MPNTNLKDEEIAVLVREEDKELYGEIIDRYQAKLKHYLRKFTRDQASIEDILQEVFIKAYRNLYGFDADKRFSSWIYRIAHNEALNFIKKNKENLSLDEFEYRIIDKKMSLPAEMDQQLNREVLEKALMKIKIKYRVPLILYFFEEKTYNEISDILHLPPSSVGTRIRRGKEQLKKILEKYG